MKQFRKSINIWRSYGQLSTGSFFRHDADMHSAY